MHKKLYISLFFSLSLVLCLAQTSYAHTLIKVCNTNNQINQILVEASCHEEKVKNALTIGVQTTTIDKFISSLSSNASFLKVLKDIRIKGSSTKVDNFVNLFVKLHKSAPANSVKSLDNVMSDFVYLVDHHLPDFTNTTDGKKQITDFIHELLQSKDKFKAGATTLEVIHNVQKYIPSKYYNTLSNLQLEDLISYADDAGDFRFDIKWSSKIIINTGDKKTVSIFIDTKTTRLPAICLRIWGNLRHTFMKYTVLINSILSSKEVVG